jgi:hypothetical protein
LVQAIFVVPAAFLVEADAGSSETPERPSSARGADRGGG